MGKVIDFKKATKLLPKDKRLRPTSSFPNMLTIAVAGLQDDSYEYDLSHIFDSNITGRAMAAEALLNIVSDLYKRNGWETEASYIDDVVLDILGGEDPETIEMVREAIKNVFDGEE